MLEQVVNTFKYNNTQLKIMELKRHGKFVKAILDLLVYHWSNKIIQNIEARDYILICINNALAINMNGNMPQCINPELAACYIELEKLRQEYFTFVKGNYKPHFSGADAVHMNDYKMMSDSYVNKVIELRDQLQKVDFFIKKEAIPFLTASIDKEGDDLKKSIYNEFKRCFTNIGSKMVKVSGTEEYYKVEGDLKHELAPNYNNLILLR